MPSDPRHGGSATRRVVGMVCGVALIVAVVVVASVALARHPGSRQAIPPAARSSAATDDLARHTLQPSDLGPAWRLPGGGSTASPTWPLGPGRDLPGLSGR
jgi:hypothetical protein